MKNTIKKMKPYVWYIAGASILFFLLAFVSENFIDGTWQKPNDDNSYYAWWCGIIMFAAFIWRALVESYRMKKESDKEKGQ